jgi:uncharacterized SAM-binding protein YcdF (DUF218 family)
VANLTWLTLAAAAALAASAEVAHRLSSRSPRLADHAAAEAIIVLGYKSLRNGRPHPVQRWRCEIAVRSMDPRRNSTLIISGASGEAQVMADYAHDVLGVPADRIVLETRARSTWENVQFSLPLAEGCDVIKIASDPLHSGRAWRYVAELRPDLADRLEPADDYRPGEHPILKAEMFLYSALRQPVRRMRGLAVNG